MTFIVLYPNRVTFDDDDHQESPAYTIRFSESGWGVKLYKTFANAQRAARGQYHGWDEPHVRHIPGIVMRWDVTAFIPAGEDSFEDVRAALRRHPDLMGKKVELTLGADDTDPDLQKQYVEAERRMLMYEEQSRRWAVRMRELRAQLTKES